MAPIHRMGAPLINQIKILRFETLSIACKHKRKFEYVMQYTHDFSQISHICALTEKKLPAMMFFSFQPWLNQSPSGFSLGKSCSASSMS